MTLTATERDLVDAASRWFDAHRAQFVDELCELLRYPSVSDESDPNPRPGAPYGPEVRRVFDHMLAKAGRDGLPTRDYTGHVMEVVYPQENVETDRDIAFVDHLDVVPADDGWTHDAFDPQAIGDIVIGRGSLDNKGVALTSYFLLRFFKEHDHRFRHRVRILFGGSEEIALNDIKWFVANIGAPYQAIVTDGPFPVNNIQKGLLDVDVELPVGPQLRGWHAGTATNTVPGAAAITLTGVDESTVRQAFCQSGNIAPDIAERLHINATAQGVTIEATGVAGHACQPSGTVNAIAVLTTALARSGLLEGRDLTAAQAIAQWTKDSYGTGLGIDCENAESGPTTANGGLIIPANEFAEADKVLGAVSGETSEDAIVLHFDIRYAVGQAHEQIIERIQAQAEAAGGRIVDILNDDPYYVQADDPRVQLLTATYNDVLGCEARPVAVGDGTHARFIPRALNFGPEFHADHVPAVDGIDLKTPPFIAPGAGNAHGADEWASLKNLKTAFVLYALGLVRLDQYLQ